MSEQRPGYWSGMLTLRNIEDVATRLGEFLKDKSYAFVTASEAQDFKPKVRTSQTLTRRANGSPISVTYNEGKTLAMITVADSKLWLLSTNLMDDVYDEEFKNPYLEFDGDTLTITQCPLSGDKLYWVIRIQG